MKKKTMIHRGKRKRSKGQERKFKKEWRIIKKEEACAENHPAKSNSHERRDIKGTTNKKKYDTEVSRLSRKRKCKFLLEKKKPLLI